MERGKTRFHLRRLRGGRSGAWFSARAFSLLEVVIVVGLIALIGGIVASMNLSAFFAAGETRPAAEIFRQATHEARIQAMNEATVVYLTFDREGQAFRLTKGNAPPVATDDQFGIIDGSFSYAMGDEDGGPAVVEGPRTAFTVFEDDLEVIFRGLRAGTGGVLAFDREYTADPLPHLEFHPSGVSTPAIAIFRYRHGDETELTLDSFSNGPRLSGSDNDY